MLNMFGGYGGLLIFGLKAIGMLGGSNEDDARYRHEMAKYKRALMMQKAKRSYAKQSLAAAYDANLDSAANAYTETMNEFWDGYGEFQLKQAEIYAKASSLKGSGAARGLVGRSAKRVEKMGIAQHLTKGKLLALQMQKSSWRVNNKTDSIWTAFKNANQQAFDKSGLGLPVSTPGGMPTRTRSNKSFLNILSLAGDTIAGNLGKDPLANSYKYRSINPSDVYNNTPDSSWLPPEYNKPYPLPEPVGGWGIPPSEPTPPYNPSGTDWRFRNMDFSSILNSPLNNTGF